MLFYCGLIILIFIIWILTNSGNKLSYENKQIFFLKICFVLFFILVGFRSIYIGNDTKTYVDLFNKISSIGLESINVIKYDKGYVFLNFIISKISNNFRFYLLIFSAIFNFTIYKFIKENSRNYLMSTILYISLLFFYDSMTMMRQFLAMCIILAGFNFIKTKKFLKYILTVLIASSMHVSAMICLIIYPLYHIKYNKKRAIIIISCFLISFVCLTTLFNDISHYLNKENSYINVNSSFKTANIVYTIIYGTIYFFTCYATKRRKVDNENSFYLYLTLFSFLMNFLSIKISILSRASKYFTIFIIVILPNIIKNSKFSLKSKTFLNLLICILTIIYANTIIICRPEWNSAFNYISCISDDSYFK